MRESGEENQLCPCYKECKEFYKLLELKNSGLMVYCHKRRTVDLRQGECAITSQDVFILDNKKNVKIKTSELTAELEKKNISCPRCREIFKHAQDLMQKVKSIDRRTVMGICDHCRKNAQTSKKLLCACDEIVKKYKSVKDTQKENIKTNVKMWLSKLGHFLKDEITLNKPKQIKTSSYSDIQINQGLMSPASKHEPEIQQMFYPEMQKSDMSETDLNEGVTTQAVTFAEPVETYTQTTIMPGTSMIDSDTTIVDTYEGVKDLPRPSLKDRKQEEILKIDIPSMDAKEALKRRHDLNLRHMMGFQKDSVVPFSVTERPEIYDIPKKVPWEQEEPTSEYHVEPEMDIKKATQTKTRHGLSPRGTSDPYYVSNKTVPYGSLRTSQKDLQELGKVGKYDKDKIKKGLTDSGKRQKEIEKRGDRYIADETLKLHRSASIFGHKIKKPHVTKSIPIETAGNVLQPQYSFLFPKATEKEKDQVTLHVTSSHLIKETQEKFHLQAEIEKKKQEEQRQQKLEQEQEKKLAREQKKLQAEEERRKAEESKKYAEEEERRRAAESKKYAEEEEKRRAAERKTLTKDKKYNEMDLETKPVSEEEKHDKTKDEKEGDLITEPDQRGKDESGVAKAGKDEVLDKSKKEVKEKSEPKKKGDDEVTDKGTKSTKEKPEPKKKGGDEVSEKGAKDMKGKLEPKKKGVDELSEKGTKAIKEKLEPKKKGGDEVSEKGTKDMKEKSEPKKKGGDEVSEKGAKDMKEKSEPKKKSGDEVSEKGAKAMKEKQEQKTKDDDQILQAMKTKKEPKTKDKDEEKEKDGKDLKSPTKQKTKMDKEKQQTEKDEQDKLQKEKAQQIKTEKEKPLTEQEQREKQQKEKEEQEKQLQLQKEHEERLKQAEELKKEREALKQQKEKEKENLSKETEAASKKGKAKEDLSKETDAPAKKGKKTDEKDVSMKDVEKSMKKEKEVPAKQDIIKSEKEEKDSKSKPIPIELPKVDKAAEEFKKLQAEHLKDKEERLKKKRQEEYEASVAKAKEDVARKVKQLELSMREVKLEKVDEDAILKMVRIKQAAKMKPCDIDADLLHEHRCHHQTGGWDSCPLCLNSELELEVLSLDQKANLPAPVITDIIIGEQIIKNKRRRFEKPKVPKGTPALYHKKFFGQYEPPPKITEEITSQEDEPVQTQGAAFLTSKKNVGGVDVESSKGILRYALSDRTFIEKGWTMLPTEKVVRKMNVYRMRPAHPEFDWFEHNRKKRLMTYDTGERLAEFDDNGRGRLYYRSGRLALDYYDAEETNAQQRFVIYSSGEPDERGRTHPITILATFDYLGNGIVFDHTGKIRLKYNQTEGVVLDRGIGPVSHWKWHTLNDPPVLQQVMIDTQMAHKDPHIYKLGSANEPTARPDNEEMLAIEFDNFIKEKSKKLSQKFKPFQIKMKALKINEHFSLKVLDQATVYLIFRDGSTNIKLNIGMILDHQEIVDTDTAEVGEVSNSLERFPARTDSLAGLQRSVAYAQRYERQYTERERRLRPPEPCASADKLTAAASRPMRPPFRTLPPEGSSSSTSTGYCSRKPASNLYYNTRLL